MTDITNVNSVALYYFVLFGRQENSVTTEGIKNIKKGDSFSLNILYLFLNVSYIHITTILIKE